MRLVLFVSAVVLVVLYASAQNQIQPNEFIFRAFGDVNLGRSVGQELLRGNSDYPFKFASGLADSVDAVFVNLESQLSDQGGETQSPLDPFMFCGPPEGAASLRNAGVFFVSTANNHAYDYGMKALQETIDHLRAQGIYPVGTSKDSVESFQPVVVEKNGIRVGMLAYTEFVNRKGAWKGRISAFEKKRAKAEIEATRRSCDIVIASYHGGTEYTDQPSEFARSQMRFLVDAGAHVVVGHHPHVPQGVEQRNGKYIFYSLGNFVFHQPQQYWTRYGIGTELVFRRIGERVTIGKIKIIPLRAGKQPSFSITEEERDLLRERIQQFSNITLYQEGTLFVLRPAKNE